MSEQGEVSAVEDVVPSHGNAEQRLAELEARLSETEKQLRRSNGKLRMALEVGKLGAWERDIETNELTINAACKANLGVPADEALTHEELEKLYHPGDVERIQQAISYALATKTDFNIEHRIIRRDGRIGRILVRGGAVYENGKPVRMIGVTQDVTEREKVKEEFHLAQRRQDFLLKLNDQLRRQRLRILGLS
jgi:PAS domain S-box-containing protein